MTETRVTNDNDDPATAWVRVMAMRIGAMGIGQDYNLFLNAVALAAGEIIKMGFPDRVDQVVDNMAEQTRRIAHSQGRPQ